MPRCKGNRRHLPAQGDQNALDRRANEYGHLLQTMRELYRIRLGKSQGAGLGLNSRIVARNNAPQQYHPTYKIPHWSP